MDHQSPFNVDCVDLDKISNDDAKLSSPSSSSSPSDFLSNLTPDKLEQTIKTSRTRTADTERLKQLLRHNGWPSKHPIRKHLWKYLLQTTSSASTNAKENSHPQQTALATTTTYTQSDYNLKLNQIFGKQRDIEISLPEFVYFNNPNLTVTSIDSSSSVSSSSNLHSSTIHLNYYHLNASGKQAIKRILCLFEYQNPHITYAPGLVSITSLLLHYMQEHEVYSALCYISSTKEHLIESKSSWDVLSSVFIRLLKTYCKSSYETLTKHASDPIESILNDWYWWIFDCLSFDYLVRIMDCFLFEGQKVLFRVSLSIVQQFTKFIKSQNLQVNKNSIKMFCESPASLDNVDKLLKTSFSIRNLKRSTIKDYYSKEEIKRKNFDFQSTPLSVTGTPNQTIALKKIDNNNNLNASSITNTSQNNSNNNTFSNRIFLNESSTSILTHSNLSVLWNWIPQRLSVYSPSVLFTTQEHGTSPNTLFNILDELEHCILVIKTFDNQIFGAFCSAAWNDRKKKVIYFGNGETFLFTMAPEKKIFRWVGINDQTLTSNKELFIRVDQNKLCIGGGGHDGLAIAMNLTEGFTDKCDTFDNEPLCGSHHFQIGVLEVIGFGNSKN